MKRTIKDIYKNETDPALYIKRANAIRRQKIEEILGGVLLLTLLVIAFTIVQVAYGIW